MAHQQSALMKRRSRTSYFTAAAAALVVFAVVRCRSCGALRRPGGDYALVGATTAGSTEPSVDADAFAEAMRTALKSVSKLHSQVQAGKIIGNFGLQAEQIFERASSSAGPAGAELNGAIDGALHALFLQQLGLLRQQIIQQILMRYQGERMMDLAAFEAAEKDFVKRATALLPESSKWSFDSQHDSMVSALKVLLDRDTVLTREMRRSAHTQKTTTEVISRLQAQMDKLSASLKGTGAPWAVWTTYRIPRTPVHVSGRYTQGRANIEFSLSPADDPINAEASFVEGFSSFFSEGIGMSLNLGF